MGSVREFVTGYRANRPDPVELPEAIYRDAEVMTARLGQDSDDARQFLLLRAVESIPRYDPSLGRGLLRTYLQACMRYALIDFFRARRKEPLYGDLERRQFRK